MESFAQEIAPVLNKAMESLLPDGTPRPVFTASDLETPPDPAMGDFAFPCFKWAKPLRKGPPQIALHLAEELQKVLPADRIEVKALGPYVNFIVDAQTAIRHILGQILEKDRPYGQSKDTDRGTWVMEYSSPNIAKPFMVGHLRTTAIGAALAKIATLRGWNVVSINHLGDWGTQYGKLAVAFKLFGQDLPESPTIDDLVKIYVRFHEEAEKIPELEDQAREGFRKLEKGDPEITALWQKCKEISLKEFQKTYDRLGVKFTHNWGESHYVSEIPKLMDALNEKKLLVRSQGALVVPVEDAKGNELPPAIIQKKDGASIYATRDLAAAIYRWDKFKFDRMTYIVGKEQKLHFEQVFTVLKKMDFDWAERLEHLSFGLYRFKGGKMSTRKGNFVTLNELIDLAEEKVRERIQDREADLPPETLQQTVEAVALGAVVFHDLSTDPTRDPEFDVESVTDFAGETGPYLQYAHTRCLSILRKAGDSDLSKLLHAEFDAKQVTALTTQLTSPTEVHLVKLLGRFPVVSERVLLFLKPSLLATYLVDITKAFNAFYRENKVLDPKEPKKSEARLMLVEASHRVLGQGLGLLGIPLPERM